MDAFMVVSYKTSNINVYLVGDAVKLVNELAIKSIPYEAVYCLEVYYWSQIISILA